MEKKQMGGSYSSFTDLFGPRDSSPSSSTTGVFGSVFGPPSTGLGRDTFYSTMMGTRKQDSGTQYIGGKPRSAGNGESKEKGSYQSETTEPCYLSSSIHYGGQEVYPPTSQTPVVKMKEDPNGCDASRGNWWQGSLYY